MNKWTRARFTPVLPLGEDGRRITGSTEHIRLSKEAAAEGMVLLKNKGHILPLKRGARIALFGKGCVDYVKGGGGSGNTFVAYVHNLYEGLKIRENEGRITLFHDLPLFYEKNIEEQYRNGSLPGMTVEPELPKELLERAKEEADIAVICICRFSGEAWDRKVAVSNAPKKIYAADAEQVKGNIEAGDRIFERGDFYLTYAEEKLVHEVTANFENVVVVLNVGGIVDSCWFKNDRGIKAALLAWQSGMEGGLAAADVLLGITVPSGKLTDTFASSLGDYPSTENFHESADYVEYTDDIYVGYRYFETIPGAKEKVNYPFGFGLSYTEFKTEVLDAGMDGDEIFIKVSVTNVGNYSGKEVIEVYAGAPKGALGKPDRVLTAFKKTGCLGIGESQIMTVRFPLNMMASYDDTGKVQKSAYVLEKGTYRFYVGTDVRSAGEIAYRWENEEDLVVEQLSEKAVPHKLHKRLCCDGSFETLPISEYTEVVSQLDHIKDEDMQTVRPAVRARNRTSPRFDPTAGKPQLIDVYEGRMTLFDFVAALPDEELANLLGGQPNTGVADTGGIGNLPDYGVPNIMTADGPAGLRLRDVCGVTTTAWPCATALACTWNTDLIEEVGRAGALEFKENNIGVWLAPAINIHRSPLCGRNFEYYSEDPLVAGMCGAAMVRGMQSEHIGASVKHFCCNNKETNRKKSDSRVSERALREIYLKGFEITVKTAQPYTIMSSYNLINGIHASENRDLLTGILRDEWGFDGLVTTDWWTLRDQYPETKAGNDLKMATGYPERLLEALDKGLITREEMMTCARRILNMILKID